jgi:hypothetical protein
MSKCSCGKCIGGFLSPNNASALKEAATSSAEVLRDSLPDFPGNKNMHINIQGAPFKLASLSPNFFLI